MNIENNRRDGAGEIIDNKTELLNKFRVSIFGIIGYRAHKNESDLIKFLNQYRLYRNNKKGYSIKNIIKG